MVGMVVKTVETTGEGHGGGGEVWSGKKNFWARRREGAEREGGKQEGREQQAVLGPACQGLAFGLKWQNLEP